MGLGNTSSRTENRSTNTTIDERAAADNGAIIARNSTVSVIDGGAIKLAENVALTAMDISQDIGLEAFDLSRQSLASTADALSAVIEADRAEEARIADQLIRIGIPALALAAIAYFVWGQK